MSQKKNITAADASARATVKPMDAGPVLMITAFGDLESDYRAKLNVWREVPERFARFCQDSYPPIDGPEASGSFAQGECFDTTGTGAVHCVIARESGRYFAKYVNLMDWATALLNLREALECGREGA